MAWNNFWPEIDKAHRKRKYIIIIIIKKKMVELTLYSRLYRAVVLYSIHNMLYAVYKVL